MNIEDLSKDDDSLLDSNQVVDYVLERNEDDFYVPSELEVSGSLDLLITNDLDDPIAAYSLACAGSWYCEE